MKALPQKFFCDELCAGAGRGVLSLPSSCVPAGSSAQAVPTGVFVVVLAF